MEWLSTNFKFIAVNGLSHLLMGLLLSTALFPFLNKDYSAPGEFPERLVKVFLTAKEGDKTFDLGTVVKIRNNL